MSRLHEKGLNAASVEAFLRLYAAKNWLLTLVRHRPPGVPSCPSDIIDEKIMYYQSIILIVKSFKSATRVQHYVCNLYDTDEAVYVLQT